MKGLKTLAAMLLGVALLASVAPATAGAAAYKHYVACGVSRERQTRPHLPEEGRKKGAFFKSLKGDVIYTRLRQVPDRQKPLRAEPRKRKQGTLYVNKITSNIPGKHRSPGSSKANGSAPSSSGSRASRRRWWSSASTPRPPTPPSAPCAAARSCTSRCSGSPPDGKPAALDRPARTRSSAAAAAAGGWEAVGADRGRRSAPAPSPACGSGSRPRAGWRRAAGLPVARRLHPRRARPRGARGRALDAGRPAARRPRRPARRGLRRALLAARASGSGSRWSRAPGARRARRGARPSRPLAAGSGAVRFRARAGESRRRDPGRRRPRPPGRRAARLRPGGGRGGARPARSTRST